MRRFRRTGSISALIAGLVVFATLAVGIATFTLKKGDLMAVLAAATTSLSAEAVVYLTPYVDTPIKIGDTLDIDVNVNAKAAINAIGTTITFSPDAIEIIGVSKKKSFLDLWTEETAIKESAGEVHFSGGTIHKAGLIGTGTALTLTVRAKRSGHTIISITDADLYASDGEGTPVDSNVRSYTLVVLEPSASAAVSTVELSAPEILKLAPPIPDLDESGKVTFVDISIMITRIVLPYAPRFDLDQDGSIGLTDLSIVLTNLNREFGKEEI